MAYKVNEKSKTVSVSGKLTAREREMLSIYVMGGYQIKNKRVSNAHRVSDAEILKYFEVKIKETDGEEKANFEKALNEYKAIKNKKVMCADGVERKGGFLKGLKWFKENHENAYKAIKEDDFFNEDQINEMKEAEKKKREEEEKKKKNKKEE